MCIRIFSSCHATLFEPLVDRILDVYYSMILSRGVMDEAGAALFGCLENHGVTEQVMVSTSLASPRWIMDPSRPEDKR